MSINIDSNKNSINRYLGIFFPCLLLFVISAFEIKGVAGSIWLVIYFLCFISNSLENELLLLLFNVGFAFDIQLQILGIPFLAILQGVYILKAFIKLERIDITVLMFLILTVMLQMYAVSSCGLSAKAISVFIFNILLAYCISYCNKNDIYSCYLIYSIGIVAVLIVSIIREHRFFQNSYFRFEGIWNDQNFLGMFCSLAVLLIYYCWRKNPKMLIPFLGVEVLLVYCAYRTYSMTFIFSCALLILVIIVDLYSDKNFKELKLLIPLMVLILGFVFYNYIYSGIILSRGRALYSAGEDWTHGRIRDTLYALNGWIATIPNMLFGFGYNNSPSYIGCAAHNTYVEILCQFGLIGTMVFLAFIIIIIKRNNISFKQIRLSKSAYIYILLLYMGALSMESTDVLYLLLGLALNQMMRTRKCEQCRGGLIN